MDLFSPFSFSSLARNYFSSCKKWEMAYNDRALCRCGIRISSARNRCPAFDKDKYLEPMFVDVGQAQTNAAMLLMPIATTSSRTCTKPSVSGSGLLPRIKYVVNNFVNRTLRSVYIVHQ